MGVMFNPSPKKMTLNCGGLTPQKDTRYYCWMMILLVITILMSCTEGSIISEDVASNPYTEEQLARFEKPSSLSDKLKRIASMKRSSFANMNPFETYPIAAAKDITIKADTEYKFLGLDFGGQYVNGHMIILKNPMNHFSIMEPPPPGIASESVETTSPISKIWKSYETSTMKGGCYFNVTSTVRDTARNNLANHYCHFATNAGFFNTHKHTCMGNVVADSKVLHTSPRHNVNFGIKKNGEYFIGYVDGENSKVEDFDQLIGGVIWLVRKGERFVDESSFIEDMTTQETGNRFIVVRASRSAIGHDKEGRLVIVHIDGDGNHNKGPSLHELADTLIELGVYNAINLDGGGSVTVVRDNDIIINSVSDGCSSSSSDWDADFADRSGMFRCPRKVMTATCIHDFLSESERAIQKTLAGKSKQEFSTKINQFIMLVQVLIAMVVIVGLSIILLLLFFTCSMCCCSGPKKAVGPNYSKLDLEMVNLAIDAESDDSDIVQSIQKDFTAQPTIMEQSLPIVNNTTTTE